MVVFEFLMPSKRKDNLIRPGFKLSADKYPSKFEIFCLISVPSSAPFDEMTSIISPSALVLLTWIDASSSAVRLKVLLRVPLLAEPTEIEKFPAVLRSCTFTLVLHVALFAPSHAVKISVAATSATTIKIWDNRRFVRNVGFFLSIRLASFFVILMEQDTGIEPVCSAWEADILPLN